MEDFKLNEAETERLGVLCTQEPWQDVLALMDQDTDRADDRRQNQALLKTLETELQRNHSLTFEFAPNINHDDEDWAGDLASRAPTPTCVINPNTLVSYLRWLPEHHEDAFAAIADLHQKTSRLLPPLCIRLHAVEWQLQQARMAMAELYESRERNRGQGGSTSRTPAFVSLLSQELQNFDPDTPPLALARHMREESDDQRAVREQRDGTWDQTIGTDKYSQLTWGKIPNEVRAFICEEMFKLPGRWPWSVTAQRCIERITYCRIKNKKNASYSSSSSSTSSSSSSSSSTPPSTPRPSQSTSSSSSSTKPKPKPSRSTTTHPVRHAVDLEVCALSLSFMCSLTVTTPAASLCIPQSAPSDTHVCVCAQEDSLDDDDNAGEDADDDVEVRAMTPSLSLRKVVPLHSILLCMLSFACRLLLSMLSFACRLLLSMLSFVWWLLLC